MTIGKRQSSTMYSSTVLSIFGTRVATNFHAQIAGKNGQFKIVNVAQKCQCFVLKRLTKSELTKMSSNFDENG